VGLTPSLPPRTRREASWLGFVLFGGAVCVIYGVGLPLALLLDRMGLTSQPGMAARVSRLVSAFCVSLPLACLLGAISGFESYRAAAGCKRVIGGYLVQFGLLLPFIPIGLEIFLPALSCMVVFSTAQFLHHKYGLANPAVAVLTVVLHSSLLVLVFAVGFFEKGLKGLHDLLPGCAGVALFVCDAEMARRVGHWRLGGRIRQEPQQAFQFSLAVLVLFVLGLGGYLLAVLTLYPRPGW